MASRAIWQRSANRYFIQEDAKRAPKLACCPSTSSLLSEIDTKPVNIPDLNDSLISFPLSNDKSVYSNLSSDSKWWLQLQPDYIHQRGFTSEQVNSFESRNSHQFVENQDGRSINSLSKESYEFVEMDKPMNRGSKPQKIKCNQNAISEAELQRVTSKPITEVDSSKSKILEALCHSQTRAREAENAAKKAYEEKEHVIKLLFRQASQLFAYRQWVYLLQLENLCYQIKNDTRNQIPFKSGKSHKNPKRVAPAKGKRTRTRHIFRRFGHDIGRYAVVFVVGLGIVGAGLLLGWTVGWMLI